MNKEYKHSQHSPIQYLTKWFQFCPDTIQARKTSEKNLTDYRLLKLKQAFEVLDINDSINILNDELLIIVEALNLGD